MSLIKDIYHRCGRTFQKMKEWADLCSLKKHMILSVYPKYGKRVLKRVITHRHTHTCNKIMQPDMPSINPGMQVQQHCSQHSSGFQWRLGFSTKLLVSVLSVSIRTVCHHIFLTFIHTVPIGHCALSTPLFWQFLASLLRPLGKDLSLLLDPLSWTPYHYPWEKQPLKRNLRPIYLKFICAEVQVSFCMYHSGGVCVCVCVFMCVCVYVCMYVSLSPCVWMCLYVCTHMLVCVCALVRETVGVFN